MSTKEGVKISQLPEAGLLTGDEIFVGVQAGETKRFPISRLLPKTPYFQPLQGFSATIPLPDGIFSANVKVLDENGEEALVSIKHSSGLVQISSLLKMDGWSAVLTF